jgi:hypothetical protein
MVLGYYIIICILSLICCSVYYWKKRSYYSVRYTLIFLFAFLAQFCYVLLALSRDVREALVINKFLYIGGCYLPLIGLLLVFSICKIHLPKWIHFSLMAFSTLVYCCVLTAGYLPLFYESVDIRTENGVTVLVKEYGPLHNLFLIEISFFLIATCFALLYGWRKKPDVSKRNLGIAAFMQIFSILAYGVGRLISDNIEWMALADLVDEIGFLLIMDRIGLYRVDDMVSSSILKDGKFGYISLDFKRRFLSATDGAKRFIPDIANNHADSPVESEEIRKLFDRWIDDFESKNVSKPHIYRNGDFIYTVSVSDLYDGTRKRGYLLEITDDTAHQLLLEETERYYKGLNEELREKTRIIGELRQENKDSLSVK